MGFVKYLASQGLPGCSLLFGSLFHLHRWVLGTYRGSLVVLVIILSGCEVLPGHWRPGWNQPWPTGTPVPDTAASWKVGDLEKQDGRFVAMAISGGGSRAANFGAAVMLELDQRKLLGQVDVISGVSGGTLPAAYYVLGQQKAGPFTEEAVRTTFGYDFQSSWLRRWFLPQNIFRYWLTDFTRSDIMVQVFNNRLYHHATFGDFRPHPKILINSTTHNDHTRFTFTDDRFQDLHSSLAQYQVANAINASSAFPAVFDDVTLQQYTDPPRYLHLYDGGPMDNLGIQSILEFLGRAVTGTALDMLFPNGCLIIVVDAATSSSNDELAERQSSRRFIDYFINTNALDAVDAMLNAARTNLLTSLGLAPVDQKVQGEVSISDLHQCRCEVRHVALRHLLYRDRDEELAARVTRIKTKFWISAEEQADLFTAAKLLVKELEDSHLLPDASLKTQCGTHAAAAQK
ncbi:MAG TPA: patatin-like phospholipase family protein [Nitrospiraceae bacterium]|nr:patatin-like phospholipase family protein [Nitrospiraceae bacterium]